VITNGSWYPGNGEDESQWEGSRVAEKRVGEDNGTVEARKF